MNLLETLINNYDASDIVHEVIIIAMLLMLFSSSRIKVRWRH